jgi:two-component system chemotaxis response regulator CheY
VEAGPGAAGRRRGQIEPAPGRFLPQAALEKRPGGARIGVGRASPLPLSPIPMWITRSALICDDQFHVRSELKEGLRYAGYTQVTEATNTDDSLAKWEKFEPDLAIMDVTLLGSMDALVTVRLMCQKRPQGIVLVTGTASQNPIVMEALTMGAVDFILKPLNMRAVRACLDHHG